MADVKPLILDSGIIKQVGTGDILGVANGGTGQSTLTDNGVLIGNGTGAVDVTSAGTTGQVLVGVTGGNPAFGSSFIGRSIAIYKQSDETVSTSTTPQDDAEFSFAIGANEVWEGVWFPTVISPATAGLKVVATLPSGASGRKRIAWGNTGNADSDITTATGATFQWLIQTYGRITFRVVNSSAAGTVQFQWSQNVSDGGSTIMRAGSFLIATRMA